MEKQRDEALSALREVKGRLVEREEAAKESARNCKRLSEALECTSDAVMSLDREWTILYGNRQAIESLKEFRVGGNLWDCFPALPGTEGEEQLRRTMAERTMTRWRDFCPHHRWYNARAFPTDEGLSIFLTDVTDERSMREQLAQEQEMRERRIEALSHMAGGLAHEISNPLAIIHARASDLRDLTNGSAGVEMAEVREVCESIVSTSDRAIRILRGLRNFGREAGHDPMEWASIHDIVDECMELQVPRYERRDVGLSAEIEAQTPLLLCRETQIGQIVTNLLNNALDAIDQGEWTERWVRLSARQVDAELWLEVTDSGPGVEKQFRTQLMEPFFTTKSNSGGTGVGLSLSRAIAQEHGGTLTLLEGTEHTCFRLQLPFAGPEGTADTREQGAEVRDGTFGS